MTLLTIDVGNTNTVLGLFEGDDLVRSWRIKTDARSTADEMALVFRGLLADELDRAREERNADFAVLVVAADESVMLFTSRRDNTTGKLIAEDGMYYEDIYSTTKQNNVWTPPYNLPAPVMRLDYGVAEGLRTNILTGP